MHVITYVKLLLTGQVIYLFIFLVPLIGRIYVERYHETKSYDLIGFSYIPSEHHCHF